MKSDGQEDLFGFCVSVLLAILASSMFFFAINSDYKEQKAVYSAFGILALSLVVILKD